MPPRVDLTGQKFGKLLVVSFSHKAKGDKLYWLCQCECGNKKAILGTNLKRGHTKSCGCLFKEPRFRDLSGKTFGRLEVLEFAYKDIDGRIFWKCKCQCGNIKDIQGYLLTSGTTKSCGCLHKEKTSEANFKNLQGQTFGRLTVLEYSHKDSRGKSFWKCLCQCGSIKIIQGYHLINGDTKSCGCISIEKAKKRVGKKHQNYNPEITDEERLLKRRYLEYKEWRTNVYIRDNRTCQCCGSKKTINAHHILNYSEHKDLRTNIDNGITLCETCHIEFHKKYGRQNNTKEQLNEFIKDYKENTGELICQSA